MASLALLKERWGYEPFGRNTHVGRFGDGPNTLLPNLARKKDEDLKLFDSEPTATHTYQALHELGVVAAFGLEE